MVIVLPSADALLSIQATERQLGVQLYFAETSYRLLFEALRQVIKAKDNRLAALRDIFHGTLKAQTFSFGFTRFPWLNNSQEEAVNKVMHATDVAIVHGLSLIHISILPFIVIRHMTGISPSFFGALHFR